MEAGCGEQDRDDVSKAPAAKLLSTSRHPDCYFFAAPPCFLWSSTNLA